MVTNSEFTPATPSENGSFMIDRSNTTRMVMPRAEVELNRDPDYPKVELHQARCVKCKSIIADNSEPIDSSGLKPDVRSIRIKCKNCKTINFVSHK